MLFYTDILFYFKLLQNYAMKLTFCVLNPWWSLVDRW